MRQTALNSSSNSFCCYICTCQSDQEEEGDKSDSKHLSKSNSNLDVLISRAVQESLMGNEKLGRRYSFNVEEKREEKETHKLPRSILDMILDNTRPAFLQFLLIAKSSNLENPNRRFKNLRPPADVRRNPSFRRRPRTDPSSCCFLLQPRSTTSRKLPSSRRTSCAPAETPFSGDSSPSPR
ncbi:hypothetical protein LXL04_025746 [Taraxacum kok-saghyz]